MRDIEDTELKEMITGLVIFLVIFLYGVVYIWIG